MDSPHITQAQAAAVRYNSDPPTSERIFAFVAAPGIYSSPVADGLGVRALEHGHVVQYGSDIPSPVVSDLAIIGRRYPSDVLLAPRAGLTGIALTACGQRDRLAAFDKARVFAFVEAMRGRFVHGWTRTETC